MQLSHPEIVSCSESEVFIFCGNKQQAKKVTWKMYFTSVVTKSSNLEKVMLRNVLSVDIHGMSSKGEQNRLFMLRETWMAEK